MFETVLQLNMASERNRFSKLKGRENYGTWKLSAKSYLVIKKCWPCIEKGLNSDATPAQKEADQLAWSELILLIDESVYSYMAETNTARDAWKSLENAFEDIGMCRKVGLLKQMIQLKMSDCTSIKDYVNRMTMTSLKAKKAGLKLDDEIIASFLLAGLPNDFNPLVMAIEASSDKLTSDGVKTLLLQETRFDIDSNEEGGEAFFMKSKRNKVNHFRCHNCGEPGHFARSCPLKNDGAKVDQNGGAVNFMSVRRGNPL